MRIILKDGNYNNNYDYEFFYSDKKLKTTETENGIVSEEIAYKPDGIVSIKLTNRVFGNKKVLYPFFYWLFSLIGGGVTDKYLLGMPYDMHLEIEGTQDEDVMIKTNSSKSNKPFYVEIKAFSERRNAYISNVDYKRRWISTTVLPLLLLICFPFGLILSGVVKKGALAVSITIGIAFLLTLLLLWRYVDRVLKIG